MSTLCEPRREASPEAPGTEAPLVLKFGGTSLGSPRRLRRAALRIRAHHRAGRTVVAVVSARGAATDRILAAAARVGGRVPEAGREMDRALATGEDLAAALLAAALAGLGVPARSLRGGEAGVEAAGVHGSARIVRVRPQALGPLLARGIVPVVSGFQGVRDDGETVTLGRGGSDTSAVAIAAALGAECHIVTDVAAVCDRDPRLDPAARPLDALDHRALLRLAEEGARVVHEEAARFALRAGVPLRVYSHRARPGEEGGTRVAGARPASAAAPLRVRRGPRRPPVPRYRLEGTLDAAGANLVVVFHSLTGDSDVLRWWPGVVGPGLAVDTDRWAVLCADLAGLPHATPRDMAAAVRRLVAELGVRSPALVTGGSLGGMAALEWAASFPGEAGAVVSFAAPAAHTAYAIGWSAVQRRAIALGGEEGLAVARMAAMLTYRTPEELEGRFGRAEGRPGGFAVEAYLEHHGARLRERFDRTTYLALLGAMDAHDVGRGRGGVGAALRRFSGRLVGVGIPGDLLYPDAVVRGWVEAAGAEYRCIHSTRGHDAFLLEPEQVGGILRDVLASGTGTAAQRSRSASQSASAPSTSGTTRRSGREP